MRLSHVGCKGLYTHTLWWAKCHCGGRTGRNSCGKTCSMLHSHQSRVAGTCTPASRPYHWHSQTRSELYPASHPCLGQLKVNGGQSGTRSMSRWQRSPAGLQVEGVLTSQRSTRTSSVTLSRLIGRCSIQSTTCAERGASESQIWFGIPGSRKHKSRGYRSLSVASRYRSWGTHAKF